MSVYRILIADDEPLVRIGLETMLSSGFENIEVAGTAANGQEALDSIEKLLPDIVIADIKMPLMSGLELMDAARQKFGPVPVFIILTAYEELDLVRQAISGQAVDYLVKIELTPESLHTALDHAIARLAPYKKQQASSSQVPLQSFRQNFLLALLNRKITNKEELQQEAANVRLPMNQDRYIAVYAVLDIPYRDVQSSARSSEDPLTKATPGQLPEHFLTLYNSCLSMTQQIVERYAPCLSISNDPQHFTLLFGFGQEHAVAAVMAQIEEAVSKASQMIHSYFNVDLYFGIGSAVVAALEIPDSFEEARSAAACTSAQNPVRLFSHIVGANRQSGKDKLIAAIRQYIDENLDGKLQLSEVSKIFGLSPTYLSMLFKKSADVGFTEYVYTRKIEKAKELLLQNDMKVYEVADALGFESAYYFSRVFRKVEGISPREFIARKSGKS